MPGNWTKIRLIETVQLYADRYDQETYDGLWGQFIYLAEDRLNRIIKTRHMSNRILIPTVDGQSDYDLPSDFDGARDIAINGTSLHYLNPEQLNNVSDGRIYYSIIANKLRITPTADSGHNIDMVYYQRLPSLANGTDTNWLLADHGDIYVTATLAEVESYTKNDQRAMMFWGRLDGMFDEIDRRDWEDRWSGNPLSTKLEDPSRGT